MIPKCRTPAEMGDLRNISCTMLPSKIYESYVLNWLSTEVSCKDNQYGGIKGCSVDHLLVDLWDEVLWNLEDERAATMITGIDYAKAFNRLSFQHCLRAFARKGASSQTISLLSTFLSNRTMSVRVSDTWSVPKPVYGGVPQGSILGVLLFNIATDDLEDPDDNDQREFVHDSVREDESTGSVSSWSDSVEEVVEPAWGCRRISRRSPDLLSQRDPSSESASPDQPSSEEPSSEPVSTDLSSPGVLVNVPTLGSVGAAIGEDSSSEPGSTDRSPPDCNGGDPPGVLEGGPTLGSPSSGSDAHSTLNLTSTPLLGRGRPRLRESPLHSRGPRLTNRDWSFMPGRSNRRRRRNLQRRVNYSDEGEGLIAPEVNKKATGLRWRARDARKLKYVDDGVIACKINMQSGKILSVSYQGKVCKEKHDLITQNLFRRVVAKARARGMVVNHKKTRILCVSDALNYKALSFIRDSDGNKISSTESMKILGFHLDSRPTCHAHVDALRARMRETTWVLRHLKISGFTEKELARVYKTVVRPVLDYCCVIYHPMLTDEQDQIVERLQAQALKNIYGYGIPYAKMREMADVTTHRARRIVLCDKFAQKAAANPRFQRWFPPRVGRQSARREGHGETYHEFTARTDRLKNSPLFYYRRRLNGKEGKVYGERNRKYRD